MIIANILSDGKIYVTNNVVSDSVKFETVKFIFPSKWKDLIKTAVFKNGGQTVNIILNQDNEYCLGEDECYLPHEVLIPPEFTLSVFGTKDGVRATSARGTVRVIESGYAVGDAPDEPTASEYEQIIGIINETKSIAQSVRDDADNGEFKGPQGEKGEKGEKGDSVDLTDYVKTNQVASLAKQAFRGTGDSSHIEGYNNTASEWVTHAEGEGTTASGSRSHAEGYNTTAEGDISHAEGEGTLASGPKSHAEGTNTKAYYSSSHAEGYQTKANADFAHAEGEDTQANGRASHAEGREAIANGNYSHAQNRGTIANGENQTVFGKYNVSNSNYAEIVGNGTSNSNRSNARTLDWQGNEWVAGSFFAEGGYIKYYKIRGEVANFELKKGHAYAFSVSNEDSNNAYVVGSKITNLSTGATTPNTTIVGIAGKTLDSMNNGFVMLSERCAAGGLTGTISLLNANAFVNDKWNYMGNTVNDKGNNFKPPYYLKTTTTDGIDIWEI